MGVAARAFQPEEKGSSCLRKVPLMVAARESGCCALGGNWTMPSEQCGQSAYLMTEKRSSRNLARRAEASTKCCRRCDSLP